MNTKMISVVMASSLMTAASIPAYANEQNAGDSRNSHYIGTGIGAVAGALVAGPAGFIAGGLIGNIAGRHDTASRLEQDQPDAGEYKQAPASPAPAPESTHIAEAESIILAQTSDIDPIIEESNDDASSSLKDTLIKELEVDVFFLSGSTLVEDYYQPQFQMLSSLLQQMPEIHVYLDGYSDRRGDSVTNLALSNQRLDSVREQLLQAGIDEGRIHMNAFGEQQFASKPGDLEAYTFDRRVVVRFGYETGETKSPVAMTVNQPSP